MYFKIAVVLAALGILQAMFLLVVNSEAKQDHRDILRDGGKNSLGRTWHRQSFLKIAALAFGMALPFAYLGWQVAAALLLLEGAEFWVLFDRRLNSLRGKELDYVGKTSGMDVFFRKVFAKEPGRAMLVCKLVTAGVGVVLLAYYLTHYFVKL